MKPRSLPERRGDGSSVRASVVFEFRAVATGRVDDLGAAFEEFQAATQRFYAACDAAGVSVVQGGGHLRPMTQEELLAVIPRKWHLEFEGRQLCDTPYVSKRYLTKEKEKVTCKLCLKKMAG